ncbi:uncharacterized protein MELLADRAFT_73118 [Melampsora larici-populina 98AG31]|uniref:Uncharacterized protein n=1 Tax=Melampsora larici-populina (strain 98AG31 / pathotype 3-4-7) TaxID=747676 RepID=F4S3E3_MELLP|nr:uncharacterized protein MELLADRAFT_73118 [Melampsora larici-populina 98AG31]EGG00852.1 hypothetical protein MELLADRAFT_73118 [Melampsora larici-populina 98AG31]
MMSVREALGCNLHKGFSSRSKLSRTLHEGFPNDDAAKRSDDEKHRYETSKRSCSEVKKTSSQDSCYNPCQR